MSDFTKVPLMVQKLEHFTGELPAYETVWSSGFDVRAQVDCEIVIPPGQRAMIPTGLAFAIPPGYEIQVRPRSGLAAKKGISVPNSPGTVDADYRGEVKIILINLGDSDFSIHPGDRIAQLVLCPVVQAAFEVVEELPETTRGAGGFGSTGKS